MASLTFPTLSPEKRLRRLIPPTHSVRVVIDTDTRNEIDDQFALAWALLSSDQMTVEAVYAEPYSFRHRADEIRRALAARSNWDAASEVDRELWQQYAGLIPSLQARGYDLATWQWDDGPEPGMEHSYEEIKIVYDKLGVSSAGKAFRGSPGYLTSLDVPIRSDSAEHLVELAMAAPDDDPIYVAAIGVLTNIASAILIEPRIIEKIVVTWTAGYPSHVRQTNFSFNMEQDMIASKLVLDCGVPFVYLPGFHVGAQLRLSLPEVEQWVRGQGAMGDYLYWLYTHNPHYDVLGWADDHFGRTWVIWDLINIAWLMNPAWVPSVLMPTPVLQDDRKWYQASADRHFWREAYDIDRDAVFRDLFRKLEAAP